MPEDIYGAFEETFSEKLGRFFQIIEPRAFTPSAIERHPVYGSFFILSSRGPYLIEISSEGAIKAKIKLDGKDHNQPEGIAFTPDNTMIISDEAGENRARLTFYLPDTTLLPIH